METKTEENLKEQQEVYKTIHQKNTNSEKAYSVEEKLTNTLINVGQ